MVVVAYRTTKQILDGDIWRRRFCNFNNALPSNCNFPKTLVVQWRRCYGDHSFLLVSVLLGWLITNKLFIRFHLENKSIWKSTIRRCFWWALVYFGAWGYEPFYVMYRFFFISVIFSFYFFFWLYSAFLHTFCVNVSVYVNIAFVFFSCNVNVFARS